jgi:hypothetical protein
MTSSSPPARVEPPGAEIERAGPPGAGDGLERYDLLWRVAQRIAKTAMVPKALRGDAHEVLAVMAYGDELGIGPMAALRSIHMIEGAPTCSAQLMRALILGHGHVLQWREVRDDRVTLYGRRRDTGSDATVTWSMDEARRAKLLGKGNWGTYPRAMLAARATSELARLLFADLLHGVVYTPEEVGAVGPYDAIDVEWQPPVVDVETGEIMESAFHDAVDADERFAPGADPDDPAAHADEDDLGRPFDEPET